MSNQKKHEKKAAWLPALIAIVVLPIVFYFVGRWFETRNAPPEARES